MEIVERAESITIVLDVKNAEQILSLLTNQSKHLNELTSEIELSLKKKRYEKIKWRPGPIEIILRQEWDKRIRECYFKYNQLGIKEMIKKTRMDVTHLPWCSWDIVYTELRKIKKALNPRKGQLWLFREAV